MASKGDIIPLSESTAGEDSHMGEVIAFDHIHLISRDPKAVADWYKEMFGRKPQGQAYGNHGNHRVRPILYRCHGIMFCPPQRRHRSYRRVGALEKFQCLFSNHCRVKRRYDLNVICSSSDLS